MNRRHNFDLVPCTQIHCTGNEGDQVRTYETDFQDISVCSVHFLALGDLQLFACFNTGKRHLVVPVTSVHYIGLYQIIGNLITRFLIVCRHSYPLAITVLRASLWTLLTLPLTSNFYS